MEPFDELLAVLNHLNTSTDSGEGACYAPKNGTINGCVLCGTVTYNSANSAEYFRQHGVDPRHLLKLHRFKQSLTRVICMVSNFDANIKQRTFERLEKLGRTIWSDAVQASLLRHLTRALPLTEVTDLLDKYEFLEPQALLGLAVLEI
jgi:hypothetical protein